MTGARAGTHAGIPLPAVLVKLLDLCCNTRWHALVQGDCATAPPATLPLDLSLRPRQCVLQSSGPAHFAWPGTAAAANVWLDRLYLLNGNAGEGSGVSFRPSGAAALWLTNVTVEGGFRGVDTAADTLAASAPFATS